MEQIVEGFLWYIAFLFSTTCHEASHAFAALKLGDKTAYESGQVSLDPLPHIKREPIGTVVVPILSFLLGGWMIGWASVPYNRRWAYDHPWSSAIMLAAGPGANLALVLIAGLTIRLGLLMGFFFAPDRISYSHVIEAMQGGALTTLAAFINVVFSLNLLLFIFNLLPIPPLDGSGIVSYFLSEQRARKYLELIHNGAFSIIGIFIAWKIFSHIFHPLHLIFVNLLFYNIAEYQ